MTSCVARTRKRKRHLSTLLGLVSAVALTPNAPNTASGQTKAYVALEVPQAGDGGQVASALNNWGDVAGRAGDPQSAQTRATIWNHASRTPKQLGILFGDEYSSAFGIGENGEVTGASNSSISVVPFLWTPNGGMRRLPLLEGDNGGQAFSINKAGKVAGYSSGPRGARAFVWEHNGGVRALGVLPGGDYSRARDLNDVGEVVGTSGSSAGERAVLWDTTGKIRDLGTLPGDYASEAAAINNAGDVVGFSIGARGMRAFRWTKGSGMQDLGVLSGGNSSRAFDISDSGEVVGSSASSNGNRAFVYTSREGMTDLNNRLATPPAASLIEAHAINNRGQILVMAGDGHEADMSSSAAQHEDQDCAAAPRFTFLLTPTVLK